MRRHSLRMKELFATAARSEKEPRQRRSAVAHHYDLLCHKERAILIARMRQPDTVLSPTGKERFEGGKCTTALENSKTAGGNSSRGRSQTWRKRPRMEMSATAATHHLAGHVRHRESR